MRVTRVSVKIVSFSLDFVVIQFLSIIVFTNVSPLRRCVVLNELNQ